MACVCGSEYSGVAPIIRSREMLAAACAAALYCLYLVVGTVKVRHFMKVARSSAVALVSW